MFRPITLHRHHFTNTSRAPLKDYLITLVHETTSNPTNFSHYQLIHIHTRTIILNTLLSLLTDHNQNTTVYRRPHNHNPLQTTPDNVIALQNNVINDYNRKAPSPDDHINTHRAFLIFELNRIKIED